jgi:uracil-DNA glycosylase
MNQSFAEKVRAIVLQIPKGETLTYGEVAARAGNPRAGRAVGRIMAGNFDPAIPCHRVIRADGSPGGYNRGGTEAKRAITLPLRFMDVQIERSWKTRLNREFAEPYFDTLTAFVREEYQSAQAYPPPGAIFRAFDLCPFDETRVVILGQDPYHGPRQANGLCFAVHDDVAVPPSLKNIFKEIESDLGVVPEKGNGDLTRWATQGVLLLNATLTVRKGQAASHQGKGWEQFTDAAVRALAEEREGLVFMLWGRYAKQKGAHIDREKHLVLESAHPSPLAAHGGFFGSRHFSQANEYLKSRGEQPIDWR